ncbi:MAG TPA: class I adenylate-forming enzyme family protein [Steroidobacteraceae bacterium]|jgi:acyl-CoA synthetase (AMP-forming)/AMP-acid ligase II
MNWFRSPGTSLPEMVALHGKWRAARSALVEGEKRLTWGEFERDSAKAANGLKALGMQTGDRVALLMDNSLEMVVALFGVIRCGCVAVPLNTSIADTAVAAMIADAKARAVFASGRHCARIDGLRSTSEAVARAQRIGVPAAGGSVGEGWSDYHFWLAPQSAQWRTFIGPDQDCNIIYSSGTTSTPKGIVHSHGCRMHWAVDLALMLRYRSDCVTLCSLGLFSNITWVAMLCTVLVGGTIIVMPSFNAESAVELMERERVTHGTFVPLQLERLLKVADLERRDLSSLDTLMCCGSPLPLPTKRTFPRVFRCQLIELYGLTEGLCTVLSPEDFESKSESVGKPFLGSDIRIIGDDDRELAQGEIGEIVGLSPMLMSGYYSNDAASLNATWTDEMGRRWLRTGDLGRLDADGFLYIVDRKKDMILSGGQNIYPADIEAVMRLHPQVLDVAVIGAHSAQWGETPLAVVVPRPGTEIVHDQLVKWTNAQLGKQQRIRGVVSRASLPRNANGKILKRELRREYADLAY